MAQALFARAGFDPAGVLDMPEREVNALLESMPRGTPGGAPLGAAVAATPPGTTRKRFVNPKARK